MDILVDITVVDDTGPLMMISDGSTWVPSWGSGKLVCGHSVRTEQTVSTAAGERMCVPCWNAAARGEVC